MFLYFFFIILILILILLFIIWEMWHSQKIKKLKNEEAQLIHMEKMASLGTLAAGIAHEINNPLTFLGINLEVLLKYCKNKEKIDKMENIIGECLDGVERIKRIVKDLLTFSHRGRGPKIEVDINNLLDSTLRIVWNEIKYKVDIVKHYKAKTKIFIDPTQLGQVILNILINAYQAIKGKGIITISTDEDDTNIYIVIADTGEGIKRELIRKIFEPFFTTKGGTGLGLSVSNDIIKSYGGKIEVSTKEGEGSTFKIILPKSELM